MNFGLEKSAGICLKKGMVQNKIHIVSTFEKGIKDWTREKPVSI